MNSQTQAKPQVSIGIPVYNGEKFIRKRLDSVLAQTFKDYELIISDDASTDSTPEICKEYISRDNRIRYIKHDRNMGMTWNFNFVLNEAKYDYFVWGAQDDIWHPNFLEKNIYKTEIFSFHLFSLLIQGREIYCHFLFQSYCYIILSFLISQFP